MTTKLFFNNRPYTFSDANLISICKYLVANESIDESDKKYVLSFVGNSIIRKSYDEMDYHEFIIEDSFRISQLLCNVDNLFGRKATEEFAKEIGLILEEETTWNSTNYFESITTSEALECWKRTSISNSKESQLEAFQRMLGLLFLFDCVSEDYEQTITNVDDFGAVEFINGIVVEKAEYKGHLLLKPVGDYYDFEEEKCLKLCDIYIPPILFNAIFNTDHDTSIKEGLDSKAHLFKLKLEQLIGGIPELKRNVTISNDVEHDDMLFGKWYNYYLKQSLWDFDTLSIYLFDSNGKHNRSVQIGNKNTVFGENWSSLAWEWFTKGNRLHVIDKMHNKEDVHDYEVREEKLYIGKRVFYRNMKDAIDNAE